MVKLKCFHGTSKVNAQAIINEQFFKNSSSNSLRLGEGAYFFNQMGSTSDYTIMCARELLKHKYRNKQGPRDYCILSCIVECKDEQFMDLSDPDSMEFFHRMRYVMHERNLKHDPDFEYKNASVADTQVILELKKEKTIAVIRAPQFFGMFEREQNMKFSDRKISQNPRTYVPNVINLCVDTYHARIRDIALVEEGEFDVGHEGFAV